MDQSIKLIEIHERAIHIQKEEVKQEKKPERKGKRAMVKPPRFLGKETREEFNRKHLEFQSYSERTALQGEEVADDLYLSCETPLKRKLRASHLVDKDSVKKTSLKVLFAKMERICLPKVNVIVERKQLKHLKQEEEESINDFENRVRCKAMLCGYNRCLCDKNCYKMKVGLVGKRMKSLPRTCAK